MKKLCLLLLSLMFTTASPKPTSPIANDISTLFSHLSEDTKRIIKDIYEQQSSLHKRWLKEHRDEVIGPDTSADNDTPKISDRKLRETLWITSLLACEAAAFKLLTDDTYGCEWDMKYAAGLLVADWFLMPLLFDIYPIATIPAVLIAHIASKIKRSAPGLKEKISGFFSKDPTESQSSSCPSIQRASRVTQDDPSIQFSSGKSLRVSERGPIVFSMDNQPKVP